MADRFDTTRWSLIANAGSADRDTRAALDVLCRTYHPPVLAYVRAHRACREEAEDLTQAFFAHVLDHRLVARADPARGRFRAFLLTSLKHFLDTDFVRVHALRRGGGTQGVDVDEIELSDDQGPEQAFEREWARTVLREALARLEIEVIQSGKESLFKRLRPFLLESPAESAYAAMAAECGLRRNTLAVAVHRLRARLQELVSAVVADTVSDAADAERELRQLRSGFAQKPVA